MISANLLELDFGVSLILYKRIELVRMQNYAKASDVKQLSRIIKTKHDKNRNSMLIFH